MSEPMKDKEMIDKDMSDAHKIMLKAFILAKKFNIHAWIALRAVRDVVKLRRQVGVDDD